MDVQPALVPSDLALATMRDLAEQCAGWPLVHDLIGADVRQWPSMGDRERRSAFERTLRRTVLVAPGALERGRVKEAIRALGL